MNKAITTVLVTGATIAGVAGVLVLNPAMPSPGSATDSDESPALAEQDQSIRNPCATQVLGDGDFDGDEDDDSGEDDSGEDDSGEDGGDQESGRSISDPSTSAPSPQSTISGSQSPSQLSTTAGATTSYAGSAYQSPWGAMQVSISVSDGQITDIQWEQIPQADGHSHRINSYAAPLLVDQALQAQSASVDGVSGATYTTEGFRTSLQSAIQKAGL